MLAIETVRAPPQRLRGAIHSRVRGDEAIYEVLLCLVIWMELRLVERNVDLI
jgi:hypothetical protein